MGLPPQLQGLSSYPLLYEALKRIAEERAAGSIKRMVALTVSGILAIESDAAPAIHAPEDFKPTTIKVVAKQAPTGASLTVRIKSGTTDWATATLPAGLSEVTATAPATVIAAGTNIRLDITAVGTTYPGADLTVTLYTA